MCIEMRRIQWTPTLNGQSEGPDLRMDVVNALLSAGHFGCGRGERSGV